MKNKLTIPSFVLFAISVFTLSSCTKELTETEKYENTHWKITYVEQKHHLTMSDSMETTTYADTTIQVNSINNPELSEAVIGTQFDFLKDGKGVAKNDSASTPFTWEVKNGQIQFSFPDIFKDDEFDALFNVSQKISFNSPSGEIIYWTLNCEGNTMEQDINSTSRYRVKRNDVFVYKLEKQ